MPLPDDQFSTTMKDIKSSKIVSMFKNTLIPEFFFNPFVSKLKFCRADDQRLPFSSH